MLEVSGDVWATLIPEPAPCKKILHWKMEDIDSYFQVLPQGGFWVSDETPEYSALIYQGDFTHFA